MHNMKQSVLLTASLLLVHSSLHAQSPRVSTSDVTSVGTTLTNITPATDPVTGNYPVLVSDYTYSRIYAASLAKILSFDNAVNTSIRYATLNVDKNKSVFEFAPFNWALRFTSQSPAYPRPLHGYANIFFSGKINSDGIAKLYSDHALNREITVGGTLTLANGGDKYSASKTGYNDFRTAQGALAGSIHNSYTGHLNTAGTAAPGDYVKRLDAFSNYQSLELAMLRDFSEAEEGLAKRFWTTRWRHWLSITPRFGRHTVNVYDTNTRKLDKRSYNDFSIRAGYNFYFTKGREVAFYGTLWGEGKRKDMFSDMTPQVFNTGAPVDSTTSRIVDTKNVYLFGGNGDDQQFLFNGGIQAVMMFYFEKRPFGIDVSFSANQMVKAPGEEKRGMMYRQNYGLVFPFTSKDGENAINISIFYAHETFNPEKMGKKTEYVGARFAVPIL